MAEYIEREVAKKVLRFGVGATAAEALDKVPAADVAPVVRCKDCIHWWDREGVCLKIYSDGAYHSNAWQDRKPDDFCSYGERKDGEG